MRERCLRGREPWLSGSLGLKLGSLGWGASLAGQSLVGVGTKGQQELHGRAVAQQRREEERHLPRGVLPVHLVT